MNDIWEELYNKANEVLNPRDVSVNVSAGGVAAAVLSKSGKIYVGVCIDTACSIGMCAERNALSTMITEGESKIDKLICMGSNNNLMMPCGVCREFMMQLDSDNKNAEILTDFNNTVIKLSKLLPNWWN